MDKLGIETSLLLAQLVNFTIIVVVLSKLLYKPILGMLEKRKKNIEEGLRLTESMKEEEAKLEIKKQKVLDEARLEGGKLIEEARKRAKEEEKELLVEAKAHADDMIKKGKEEAERTKKDMEKTMREEAVLLAEAMAKRLLSDVMTEDYAHKVMKKHIKDLSNARKHA